MIASIIFNQNWEPGSDSNTSTTAESIFDDRKLRTCLRTRGVISLESTSAQKRKKEKKLNALVAIVIHLVGQDRRKNDSEDIKPKAKSTKNSDVFNASDDLVVPDSVSERQLTPNDIDGNTCQD